MWVGFFGQRPFILKFSTPGHIEGGPPGVPRSNLSEKRKSTQEDGVDKGKQTKNGFLT